MCAYRRFEVDDLYIIIMKYIIIRLLYFKHKTVFFYLPTNKPLGIDVTIG